MKEDLEEDENNNQNKENSTNEKLDKSEDNKEIEKLDSNEESNNIKIEKIENIENKITENNIIQSYYNDGEDNRLSIVESKLNKLKQSYNFCIKYQELIFTIVNYMTQLIFEKITNSIIENFNFISIISSLSELYSNISEQIKKSSEIIADNTPKNKENFIQKITQNVQNAIQLNISNYSNNLKQNVMNDGPYSKIKEKMNEFEKFKNENSKKFNEINNLKIILEQKYIKTYNKLFESDITNSNMSEYPDLVIAISDLIDLINNIISEINSFIIDTKYSLISAKDIYTEINSLVRDLIGIYIDESKNIFVDSNKKFDAIEKYFEKTKDKYEDKMFELNQILVDQNHRNKIYDLLEKFDILLHDFSKKQIISDKYSFLAKNCPNIHLFLEFLISVSPKPIVLPLDDLILNKIEVKMNPGLFRGWRNYSMLLTKQNHIIILNKPNNYTPENIVHVFQLDKITFKLKSSFEKPFLFDITPHNSGMYGTYSFDALNNKNLFELCLILNKFIDK